MRRIGALLGTFILAFGFLVPVALAADPALPHTGRVLISVGGDVTMPAGEHADAVIVVGGTATINGEVNTVVAVDGAALLQGSRSETVVAIRSHVTLEQGTVVSGDLYVLDSPVTQAGGVQLGGSVVDIAGGLTGFGFFLAAALVLWFIGLAVLAIVAGLVLAALAAKQVREAERLISREPVKTFAVGLLGFLGACFAAIVMIVTIVGAPLGFALLWGVLPVVGMLGFLISAIWIGDWIVASLLPGRTHERPYLAAVLGVLVMLVLSVVPFLSGLVTLFGVGALVILGWRTFRGPISPATERVATPVPVPG
jgi:hypothetical protein